MRRKNLMVIIFVSICVLFLCQTCLASLFYARLDFPAGDTPFSVAIGDLDGDGALDLAVANAYSDNVSVLLGNGDGTFQSAVNYAAGVGPSSVAIGDLDGDGALDLGVANAYSDNVSVLLGNGDGTFQSAVNYAAGTSPLSVAIGDLDGDGALDLAVANYLSNNVSVLVNKKEKKEVAPDIKANSLDGPVGITLGDTLSITIELDPGDNPGLQADWWVLANAPFGWYYYDAGTKQWLPGFHVSYQGALFRLTPPVEVLNTSGLPVGTYDFYFGIDGWRNGRLDYPYLYYDSVVVNITP